MTSALHRALVVSGLSLLAAVVKAEPLERLTIVAPVMPGGGSDQTARAMQQALRDAGLVSSVEVVNSPGAGGAIGLAQFVTARRGDGRALLVGGLTMVSAIRANGATVSLDQATPIARLTAEFVLIAVPADSELRSLEDLVQALRSNPGAWTWAGDSAGGVDQLLMNRFARSIGVDPLRLAYVPLSGGGEVAAALAGGQTAVGVSGYAELAEELRAGRIRALAVSSEAPIPGLAAPPLVERGIPISLVNWRGVFAPPGLAPEARAELLRLVDRMVTGAAWRAELARHRWSDVYLPGDEFGRFLGEERARALRPLEAIVEPATIASNGLRLVGSRYRAVWALGAPGLAGAGLVGWLRLMAARRERELHARVSAAQQDAERHGGPALDLVHGLSDQIDRQFECWGLSAAEDEVARLMLKGLRHKEIAGLRGTSERTVRQQALGIYKKAGLEGRIELAAFFLGDLLAPALDGRGARGSASS